MPVASSARNVAARSGEYSTSSPAHVLAPGSRHLPRRVALARDYLIATLSRECAKVAA